MGCALTCAVLPAAAPAMTVDAFPADAGAGTPAAPTSTVLTTVLTADSGERVPASLAIALGEGLIFGGSAGPVCDTATVRDAPLACAPGSEIGEGELETVGGPTLSLRIFNLAGARSLAVRFESFPVPTTSETTVGTLSGDGRSLTLPLAPSVRGIPLLRLRVRIGGNDPAGDWLRSTACLGGLWSLSAALLGDRGTVAATASTPIACRPPRRPQLGKVMPSFQLGQTRRADGTLSPRRIGAVSVPAGLPADATVHVTCRGGCRGSWSSGVSAGPTTIAVRPRISVNTRGLRLQVAVASPSIRGSYLVIAFTRGADNRVNGWKGVSRGCLRLGSAPVRMRCP
ncbi:MAG: hypothetical protein JHC95_20510, partial [Solirubrobacteraceae bacterium]|nr:hypothetical protein [Solirubrobacteraceae bacterium]